MSNEKKFEVCPVCSIKHPSRAKAYDCLTKFRDINPDIISYYNSLPDYSEKKMFGIYDPNAKTDTHISNTHNVNKLLDEDIPDRCPVCRIKHTIQSAFLKCVEESEIFGGELERKMKIYYNHFLTHNKLKDLVKKKNPLNLICPMCGGTHTSRLNASKCWMKNKIKMDKYFRSLPDYSDDKRFMFEDEIEMHKKLEDLKNAPKELEEDNKILSSEEYRELYGVLANREHMLRQKIATMYDNHIQNSKLKKLENLLLAVQSKKMEYIDKF